MDRTYYADEILEMLNDSQTSEEITANKDKNVMKLIKELAGNHSHDLKEKEGNLCRVDFKTSGFYGLPKIHKSKIICQEATVEYVVDCVSHIASRAPMSVPTRPTLP